MFNIYCIIFKYLEKLVTEEDEIYYGLEERLALTLVPPTCPLRVKPCPPVIVFMPLCGAICEAERRGARLVMWTIVWWDCCMLEGRPGIGWWGGIMAAWEFIIGLLAMWLSGMVDMDMVSDWELMAGLDIDWRWIDCGGWYGTPIFGFSPSWESRAPCKTTLYLKWCPFQLSVGLFYNVRIDC